MDIIDLPVLLADPYHATDAEVRAAGEAAVAAGFTGVATWAMHLSAIEPQPELSIEAIAGPILWANGDSASAAHEAREHARLAAKHGARTIVACCMESEITDLGRAQSNLAALVDAVADAGAQVCLELLPWSGIPDLATAWSLVQPLGSGASILLDIFHWHRQLGGPDYDLLARIPGNRIGFVQIADCSAVPGTDLQVECTSNRLLPGDGIVDFAKVTTTLDNIGAMPVVSTEVFNSALLERAGALGAATAMRAATQGVIGSWMTAVRAA